MAGTESYVESCPSNIIHDERSKKGFIYVEFGNQIFSFDRKHLPPDGPSKDAIERYTDMFRGETDEEIHQKVMYYVSMQKRTN